VSHPWQAAIEEHLRGGKDNAAVDVVLDLPLSIHILAAVAQHEREIISARTSAALKAAKARGKRLGNPKLSEARRHATAATAARSSRRKNRGGSDRAAGRPPSDAGRTVPGFARLRAIPRNIQNLGSDESIQSRLNTTFELIEREGALSSKPIEHELNKIRDNFTPSLGKDHGRALLKTKKPLFEQRLAELRIKLEKFQAEIKEDLQKHLDASREAVIKYYIPRVTEHPPDSLSGQLLTDKPTEEDARRWLSNSAGPLGRVATPRVGISRARMLPPRSC
jgi:hypothetical protein